MNIDLGGRGVILRHLWYCTTIQRHIHGRGRGRPNRYVRYYYCCSPENNKQKRGTDRGQIGYSQRCTHAPTLVPSWSLSLGSLTSGLMPDQAAITSDRCTR